MFNFSGSVKHFCFALVRKGKTNIMADDKSKRDGRDRSRVAGDERYEIDYLVKELGVSRADVEDAIKAVGNDREKIIKHLKK